MCGGQSLSRVQLPGTQIDCRSQAPVGSSVRGILQARIPEWVAISFSRGSSRPRDWIHVSYMAGRFFTTEPPGKPGACTVGANNNNKIQSVKTQLLLLSCCEQKQRTALWSLHTAPRPPKPLLRASPPACPHSGPTQGAGRSTCSSFSPCWRCGVCLDKASSELLIWPLSHFY